MSSNFILTCYDKYNIIINEYIPYKTAKNTYTSISIIEKSVDYIYNQSQHKIHPNSLIDHTIIPFMELQCGCTIDEIGGILLAECKGHKQSNFRD